MGGGGQCHKPSTEITRVQVFPSELTLGAGETFQLATKATNVCGYQVSGATFAWVSSDAAVASVNSAGTVSGKSGGTVRITARVVDVPTGGRQATGSGVSGGVNVVVSGFPQPVPTVNFEVVVMPPDPVVAAGEHLQMTAMAVDSTGQRVTGINFVWTSSRPDIAGINTNTGVVTAVFQGVTVITAHVVGAAINPMGTATLVVLDANGSPMPPPNITVSPSGVVIAVGEGRDVHATVTDSLTGKIVITPITWVASVSGIVNLTPISSEGDVQRVTGVTTGATLLRARATVDGELLESGPVDVRVLAASPGVSTDWTEVPPVPYTGGIYGHAMSAVGDRLFLTGGVTGSVLSGGFREDVSRARMLPAGSLQRESGLPGWDRAPEPTSADPADRVLVPCVDDPRCMSILREATGSIPQRVVRYQVSRHAQASTDSHVYVAGGIDAQVDLGIDPSDPGAVGPDLTRYSDRVLRGAVAANGTIAWSEDGRLPALSIPTGELDIPGRTAAALVHYRNWLYLLGGWNWVFDGTNYIGRNRDEILRATIDPTTGDLGLWTLIGQMPEPLNKHAAAVAEDWLIVAGGATGADETSPEAVTDAVYIARLDPATGNIVGGGWRQTKPLPRPLEYHRMLALPDDLRVVVVGGDDPFLGAANADAYMSSVDPVTGLLKDWVFLPELPESDGLTGLSAAVTGDVAGTPVFRVYIAGGGVPIGGDVASLDRHREVYFIDLLPP